NTYSGGTTVSGGMLLVDFAANATNILPAAGVVTLGGGTLGLRGAAGAANTQTIASLALARGASAIVPSVNGASSLTLNLNSISRSVGSTLDVSNVALFGGANVTTMSGTPGQIFLANGVAYATVGGADWAATDNIITTTSILGLGEVNGYTASTPTDLSGNVDVSSGIDTTLAAGATITSLRFNVPEQRSIALGGNTLTTGGVLVTSVDQASQITGGTLRGPAGADLVVIQNGVQPFTIGAAIADNATATGLTKSGTGTLVLSGSNTYTGMTSLNAGTLTVQNGSALPDASATFVAEGATLALSASETIGSLAGGGNVALGGNTLSFGADNTSTTFLGVIGGTTGGVTKVGAGAATLSGANTYGGTTTVSAGTLRAGSTAAFGAAGTVVIANASGAVLDLNNFNTTLSSLSGGGAVGGRVEMASANLVVGNSANSTFAGTISSTPSIVAGSLTKIGSGTPRSLRRRDHRHRVAAEDRRRESDALGRQLFQRHDRRESGHGHAQRFGHVWGGGRRPVAWRRCPRPRRPDAHGRRGDDLGGRLHRQHAHERHPRGLLLRGQQSVRQRAGECRRVGESARGRRRPHEVRWRHARSPGHEHVRRADDDRRGRRQGLECRRPRCRDDGHHGVERRRSADRSESQRGADDRRGHRLRGRRCSARARHLQRHGARHARGHIPRQL
ncbi:MAG: hypothetical protein EBR23_01460, partial [Planctomycetia bacterium]|nr:hypothetical protein [Planctomycetia bacterium]